jgi:hypothetical protein
MFALGCKTSRPISSEQTTSKIDAIFDTDANNELDDQHALAYLLFSGNEFSRARCNVNATYNGGNIDEQYAEAERVLKLSNLYGKIPLLKGANGSFMDITGKVGSGTFDGAEAVNFIINEARSSKTGPISIDSCW